MLAFNEIIKEEFSAKVVDKYFYMIIDYTLFLYFYIMKNLQSVRPLPGIDFAS